MSEKKRICPSINSGMLDRLNNFVQPRTSLDFGKLGFAEVEALVNIVDVRRPYTPRDLGNPKFNIHNMDRE